MPTCHMCPCDGKYGQSQMALLSLVAARINHVRVAMYRRRISSSETSQMDDPFVCMILAGLSLKSQELTAIFLAVRLYCSVVMEYDIHTILDSMTLITTLWVIYTIRFKLKSTHLAEMDNLPIYYVVRLSI